MKVETLERRLERERVAAANATKQLTEELADVKSRLAVALARVTEIEHKLAVQMRQTLGPKSERMPTPEEEAKKREGVQKGGGYTNRRKRSENAERLKQLPTTEVHHRVPDDNRACPTCGGSAEPIKGGDCSYEYEWIPGRLERRKHIVETARCRCKGHYVRGPAPSRVQEGCMYGPGFIAMLVSRKCADAMPIYRVEKEMRRMGIPISRSTMNDLVVMAGTILMPLWEVALSEVRVDPHLQADETSVRLQGHRGRKYVWVFVSAAVIVYVFSPSRSGDTPKNLVGGTAGTLLVDGHTGYNAVTEIDGRIRGGCWSHARRYLFDALPTATEARVALDHILELFMVERTAARQGIVGTAEHLSLRRERSTRILSKLLVWLKATIPLFEPASAMGVAMRYMRNQWHRLTAFTDDAQMPIHNNASEAALRIIALIRKNSLFYGNDSAARSFMVLHSIVATCERHGINPEAYLTDVLLRIQDHPKHRIAELLPHRWKEAHGTAFTVERVITPAEAA